MTWTLLIDPISRLIDKIIPDKEAAARAKLELMKSERELDLRELELVLSADKMQADINVEEAKNGDRFASRWRPLVGYVCAFAFAYKFVVQPFLIFILIAAGSDFDHRKLPILDWAEMSPVLFGLLGLGGMRTYEKKIGVTPK